MTMTLKPNQELSLLDGQGRHLGIVRVERIQGDVVFGLFKPGSAYAQVESLFTEYVAAANEQLLGIVGELDQELAKLNLHLGSAVPGTLPAIHDVQIGDGTITFRVGPNLSSTNEASTPDSSKTMTCQESLLFIDTNRYLDIYRMSTGKKVLDSVAEQKEHVFVPALVVQEVNRNKLEAACEVIRKLSCFVKLQNCDISLRHFGTAFGQKEPVREKIDAIVQKTKQLNKQDVKALQSHILERVCRSEDNVSKALAQMFANAVPHTPEQLERAKHRKGLGNPPGKRADPIGDELVWEQILDLIRKGKRRLWIISTDGDFGSFLNGRGYLNPFLYEELQRITPGTEAFLFDDIIDGIKDFVAKTGTKAEKLPSPEEAREIKKEQESLPPLDWLTSGMNTDAARIATWQQQQRDWYRRAVIASGTVEPVYVPEDPRLQEIIQPSSSFGTRSSG
jgi:hypothetical protein